MGKQVFQLAFLVQNAHTDNQISELLLIQHSIHVEVKPFVVLIELLQVKFVLSELEVKDHLFEVFIL